MFGGLFVLSDLIEVSFGGGDGVGKISFEGVDVQTGNPMDVFSLQRFEHGSRDR